jgi:hypothetical protein
VAIRFQRSFFEGPICDEVALADMARQTLANLDAQPGPDDIRRIGERTSPDLAARVFFESVRQSDQAVFCDAIDSYPANRVRFSAPLRLAIVPGMFYREHPEVGADGRLAKSIGEKFGFDVRIVPTDSAGGVTRNSRILAEQLDFDADKPVWLVSLSKGSSEVRHYLQNYTINPAIAGWLNIAGIAKGSPLADRKLSNGLKRGLNRMLCKVLQIDFAALTEMRTDHPFWQNDRWPEKIEMIHVAPVPLSSHIQPGLRARYHEMKDAGPNDGFVPVTDVTSLPGKIYPLWGSDHFMRSPDVSALIYRLFNYIADNAQQHSGEIRCDT